MTPDDLNYSNLKVLISQYEKSGRGESRAFLSWFLENIYRFDSIDADDAVCDRANDKGIDAISVDHNLEEIHILQGKIKQKESTIGDSVLRELAGTLSQFNSKEAVQALLDGGANPELKLALKRNSIKELITRGYKVRGVLVCNQTLDQNGKEFRDSHSDIDVYDRNRISTEFIDIETQGGIKGKFSFDASYTNPMVIQTGNQATTYILPVQAVELVKMSGINDGTLFSQNVRQSLGNTKVNKALKASVLDRSEHKHFALYHNGVNILCDKASLEDDKLIIENYVVVNGAQSISTFKKSSENLSDDLRIVAKIIELNDSNLSRKITINSNNQNAIKARDLKSNNEVQLRLKEEFKRVENGKYEFEIKRGQEASDQAVLITNEHAGLLMLAYDLGEPESCHQVYKLFDTKYAEIFARPAVTAHRIIFLHLIMKKIITCCLEINNKPLSRYGLTKYFLLYVLAELSKRDEVAREYSRNPRKLFDERNLDLYLERIEAVLKSIVIDLNYEIEEIGDTFDYKSDLKSPKKCKELCAKLLRSFEKDVSRGKADALGSFDAN